jgi:hypothetical protein
VPEAPKESHRNARARRVVTGIDQDGRSTFISDELTEHRFVGDAYTVNMMWQIESLPTFVNAENAVHEISYSPPPNGFTVVTTTFPPDSTFDYTAAYERSLKDWGANHSPDPNDAPGMHVTNSIDIITVISGEIWAILETGEKLLRQGDTLVQRGTKHAWHNRSNTNCVISAVIVNAKR